jgi:DNA-directed RNA polymerase specialized sigma24 family protein
MVPVSKDDGRFEEFFERSEPLLRRALVAAYGTERGREAAAEALAYAWQHWPRVQRMSNPTGYLYRVGQSRTRSKKVPALFLQVEDPDQLFEPGLAPALNELSERQRIAVVLVHAYGWSLSEVAELTGSKKATVQVHLKRGLAKLRSRLDMTDDV